jgi:S-adenosylmethionine:tRNA ribosyltransferase-isomerase
MRTSDFDYHLPEEMIAQFPPEKRGDSRMLALNREDGSCEIRNFNDFIDYIEPGDCIVINNTKVMNARFFGLKEGEGAKIEILLTIPLDEKQKLWKCLLKPGKRVREGTKIKLIPHSDVQSPKVIAESSNHPSIPPKDAGLLRTGQIPETWVEVKKKAEDGSFEVRFDADNIETVQAIFGHTPLPPYIKRADKQPDSERYQTVFAKNSGAVAAPTAGLHFTKDIFAKFAAKGINVAETTLHVGPGTFRPVSVDNPLDHKMHSEAFVLTEDAAKLINDTHRKGGRIVAIGTTSVRVLETCANDNGEVIPQRGVTDIFLHPPMKPKVADMLLTNFHLPKSTLLMLVSTFAKREDVLNAYEVAKSANFRFYSYGDCMLLYHKW